MHTAANRLQMILSGQAHDIYAADILARDITTGKEIDEAILNDISRAADVSNSKFQEFVQQRFVKGEVDFFSPIKKNNLQTGLKAKKTENKKISILKEDRQAFGFILGKGADLHESFQYPITRYPLSIANSDGKLKKGQKSLLRNFLTAEANEVTESAPKHSRWIVDAMAQVRCLRPKKKYLDFARSFRHAITPDADLEPLTIEVINDVYNANSIKSHIREKRGEASTRTHAKCLEQPMLKGKDWSNFFHNIENKSDLLHLLTKYLKKESVEQSINIPVLVNDEQETWKITTNGDSSIVFQCNHEEADTRMVLQACHEDTNVVVESKDTDVLLLMIYAFTKHRPTNEWFVKNM